MTTQVYSKAWLLEELNGAGHTEDKVKKRNIVAVVFAILLGGLAHAQPTDFFDLVKTGTPQSIQAPINQGEDVNAS
jgi:hypothetical protein